jgi:hypothetical protein
MKLSWHDNQLPMSHEIKCRMKPCIQSGCFIYVLFHLYDLLVLKTTPHETLHWLQNNNLMITSSLHRSPSLSLKFGDLPFMQSYVSILFARKMAIMLKYGIKYFNKKYSLRPWITIIFVSKKQLWLSIYIIY